MPAEMIPQQPGHAPGWKWRQAYAGKVERPWAWSEINGGEDLPAHVNGICELGWHTDCPQSPLGASAGAGQCSCTCHLTCQWFALCDRPTAGDVDHPVLGPVPTCARCAERLDLTFVTQEAS